LDNSLEYYGSSPAGQYGRCHVGLSSQAESTSDTKLIDWAASVGFSGLPAENYSFASGSAPFWGARRKKARFTPGFGGGDINLNEMGVSPSLESDQTNGLFTARALTRDSNGDPTTVSVLSTEYLDVWYTRRIYPDHIIEETGATDDGTGSVDIDGTSYDYTIRPALLGNSGYWGYKIDRAFNIGPGLPSYFSKGGYYEHPATLGAVTANLSSGNSWGNAFVNNRLDAYTNFSYNRTAIWSSDIDEANWAGGIGGIAMETSMGSYQLILDAGVPKDDQLLFEWYCNWAWTRKTL
jgi:hypothetical protein